MIFDLQGSTSPLKMGRFASTLRKFHRTQASIFGFQINGCQVSGISEVGKIPRTESSILAKGKPFYNSKHFSLSKKLFLLDFGRTNHEVLVRHDKFWVQQESNLWAADKHSRRETPYVFSNTIQILVDFPGSYQLYHIICIYIYSNGHPKKSHPTMALRGNFAISFSARLNLDASVDGEKEPIPPAVRGSTWERTRGSQLESYLLKSRTEKNFLLDGNPPANTWIFWWLCVKKLCRNSPKKTHQKAEFLHIWKIQVWASTVFLMEAELCW